MDAYPGGLAQVMDSVLLAVTPFSAQSRIVTGIPAGCHRIKYKVRDDCDNEANINCVVCVEDKISPVAICDDSLQVIPRSFRICVPVREGGGRRQQRQLFPGAFGDS